MKFETPEKTSLYSIEDRLAALEVVVTSIASTPLGKHLLAIGARNNPFDIDQVSLDSAMDDAVEVVFEVHKDAMIERRKAAAERQRKESPAP